MDTNPDLEQATEVTPLRNKTTHELLLHAVQSMHDRCSNLETLSTGEIVDDLAAYEYARESLDEVIGDIKNKLKERIADLNADLNPETEKPKRRKAKPKEVKYRHPTDESLTWAGKGRKPKWLTTAIAAGDTLETFAV